MNLLNEVSTPLQPSSRRPELSEELKLNEASRSLVAPRASSSMASLLPSPRPPSLARRLSRLPRTLVSSHCPAAQYRALRLTRDNADAGSCSFPTGADKLVIKAQVLAGGRGKGHFSGEGGLQGGVQMVDS
jgi:hypothetical protein